MNAERNTGLAVAIVVLAAATAPILAAEPARDAFGDPLPDGALARLGSTRLRIVEPTCVAISPDGRFVAAGDAFGSVQVWLTHTGERAFTFHLGDRVGSVGFSGNGKRVAGAAFDGRIAFHSTETGTWIAFKQIALIERPENLLLSPDLTRLLVESRPDQPEDGFEHSEVGHRLYSTRTCSLLWARKRWATTGYFSFSPDSRRIAVSGQSDGEQRVLAIVDAADGRVITTAPSRGWLNSGWSADSRTFVAEVIDTDSRLATSSIRSAYDGRGVRNLNLSGMYCGSSRDGRTFVSQPYDTTDPAIPAVKDETLVITRKTRVACSHSVSVRNRPQGCTTFPLNVELSDDGRFVVALGTGPIVRIIDADSGKDVVAPVGPDDWPEIRSFDGRTVETVDEEFRRVWDARTGRALEEVKHAQRIHRLHRPGPTEFRGGGTLVTLQRIDPQPDHHEVFQVLESASGKTFAHPLTIEWRDGIAYNPVVAVSPDGKHVATASVTVNLWEVPSGKLRAAMKGHTHFVRSVGFSPDGSLLATGSVDRTVKVWSTADGKLLRTFVGHEGAVVSLAFSPDGKRLASGSEDTTVLIWDLGKLTEGRR